MSLGYAAEVAVDDRLRAINREREALFGTDRHLVLSEVVAVLGRHLHGGVLPIEDLGSEIEGADERFVDTHGLRLNHRKSPQPLVDGALRITDQVTTIAIFQHLDGRHVDRVEHNAVSRVPESIELLRAWGFKFKSAAAWAKQSSTGKAWHFGTGYVFRSAAEFIVVGTIGKPKVNSRSIRNLIVAPVREHSRKPDDQYTMVEALYAGPYAEIFSRTSRPGWDCWGNEAGKFAEVPA